MNIYNDVAPYTRTVRTVQWEGENSTLFSEELGMRSEEWWKGAKNLEAPQFI